MITNTRLAASALGDHDPVIPPPPISASHWQVYSIRFGMRRFGALEPGERRRAIGLFLSHWDIEGFDGDPRAILFISGGFLLHGVGNLYRFPAHVGARHEI